MKKSNKIISVIFTIIAILLIFIEVRFLSPLSQPSDEPIQRFGRASLPELNTPYEEDTLEVSEPDIPRETPDRNMPEEIDTSSDSNQPNDNEQKEPEKTEDIGDPNDPLVAVHINNMQMKDIMSKLMDWTGKSIIPSNDAMKAKITVFTPDKLPRSKALQLIYSALKEQGYIVEQYDEDTIKIKQISDATKLSKVPIIDSNTPLASIQNKEEIVQVFFKLNNYTPTQMEKVLLPMLGEYGNISSDDDTQYLVVIDTVRTLIRMEQVIKQFDTSAAEPMVEDIFEIHYRKPTDVIQLLKVLIVERGNSGSSLKSSGGSSQSNPGQNSSPPPAPNRNKSPRNSDPSNKSGGSATSVTIGTGRTPPTYIIDPRDSLIIVRATESDMELIRKWINKLDTPATMIDENTPLESIENKNQVVQRLFKLENYSPTLMMNLVRPMLNNNGYISAEESTRTLLITDTVDSLIGIKSIIENFDVPGTEQAVSNTFFLQYADPAEVVQVITMLLSQDGSSSRSSSGISIRSSSSGGIIISSSGRRSSSGGFMPTTTSAMLGGIAIPVVLIPYRERMQIIARGPAEAMKQIEEWIIKLDQKESIDREYDLIVPQYVDVSEVSSRISSMLSQMPGQEIQKSVLIQPLSQAGQIMVSGKKELREMVKKLIMEIDIPPGIFETNYFKLKHADPDTIKRRIDELYSPNYNSGSSSSTSIRIYEYYDSYGGGLSGLNSNMTKDSVRVIADTTLGQVTVIAAAENMKKIEKQILEWDVPIDAESLRPRFLELKNVDPVKMAQFLNGLFSRQSSGSSSYSSYYDYDDIETKKKIVGPLFDQLTFEYIPGTKKIIVISKIPEAYDIIEKLVSDIDSEEMAEVPTVVPLKFANPERLCEILNATFSQPGANVEILRSDSGLTQFSMTEEDYASNNNASNESSKDGYTPWWGNSVSRNMSDDERPISNVIGKIRFVPENRTKSILVLSPPEFVSNIEALIDALDRPSKQVMIKAVIVEVDHKNLSSLGVQLATNPSAFGSLGENSIAVLNTLQQLDVHGSTVFGASGEQGTLVSNVLDAEIYGLLDFLDKKVNAKILNQQTLWTQNNEEASFFKGDRVAFYTSASTSITAGNVQDTEFQRVGMNVAVRPSITPNKEVDMNINILISQLTNDEKNGQPVRTEMETKTKMVVSDGQTLMLGGILFQQDQVTKRGVPGLSDIPLIGGLFTHTEKNLVNNELIVFITPYVYGEDEETGEISPEILKQINIPLDQLNKIRNELKFNIDNMDLPK